MRMIEKLIRHILDKGDCWFATTGEVARQWARQVKPPSNSPEKTSPKKPASRKSAASKKTAGSRKSPGKKRAKK